MGSGENRDNLLTHTHHIHTYVRHKPSHRNIKAGLDSRYHPKEQSYIFCISKLCS